MNFKYDFRLLNLLISFIPLTSLLVGIIVGVNFYRTSYGMEIAVAFVASFYLTALRINKWNSLVIYHALKSKEGVSKDSFLTAEFEDPDTFHKLKVFGDDAGIVCGSNGVLTIVSLKNRYEINIENLTMNVFIDKGKGKGVEMDFLANGDSKRQRFISHFQYTGDDLKEAADRGLKAEWAIDQIKRMCGAEETVELGELQLKYKR